MKRLALLMLVMLSGCSGERAELTRTAVPDSVLRVNDNQSSMPYLRIVRVGGCDYVVVNVVQGVAIVHAGDCLNSMGHALSQGPK